MESRIVILHTDGTPVKLDEKFTKVLLSDMGFLNSFTYGLEDYIYLQNKDFGYHQKDVNLQGYYTVRSYHAQMYTHYGIPIGAASELNNLVQFPFINMSADPGETITVWALDIGEPFNYFYKTSIYEFKIENENGNITGGKAKKYKKPVYSNSKLINYELDIPSTAFRTEADFDPQGRQVALRYFFMKNFGDFVNVWDIDPILKKQYKRAATNTTLKINQIFEQIIVELVTNASFEKMELNTNGNVTEPNVIELTSWENVIFQLLWSWGYWYQPNSSAEGTYKTVLKPVVEVGSGTVPTLSNYIGYYNSIASFFTESFKELKKLKELDDDAKLEKFLQLLSIEGLRLIPYGAIKKKLKEFILRENVTQEEEQQIVRLVLSVAQDKSNDFLNFLLIQGNEKNTNFERIFKLLDDARTERYPIVAWFVREQTNRKYFVYGVYELWKKSTYNYYYVPAGVIPNEDEMNPNSFFLNEGLKYYPKYNQAGKILSGSEPVLEFSVTKEIPSDPYYSVLSKVISYGTDKNMEREKIVVKKLLSEWINVVTVGGSALIQSKPVEEEYGRYHLYQPLILLGYKSDDEITIPNLEPIPAFLFYYSVDFEKIKDFDAAISFAAEVTIELALLYFTMGGGALRHLRHLKYITEINNVRKGLVAPETAVLFWRGLESGAEAVSVTSAILTSFFNYQTAIADDEDLKDLNRYLSYFFLALTLGSAGVAIYSSRRTVKAANNVIDEMERLNSLIPPKQHNMPQNVIDVIIAVGNLDQKISLMSNKLVGLDLPVANNIISKYNSATYLTKQEKYQFFYDYFKLDFEDYWIKMNRNDAEFLDIWKTVEKKPFRGHFWFLENTSIIRNSDEMNKEIFLGLPKKTRNKKITDPSDPHYYTYDGKGVHYKTALKNPSNPNGLGDIILGPFPLGKGFYEAKIRVWIVEINAWRVKKKPSTFFPDDWSQQRIQEELAIAFQNKKFQSGNAYNGKMSNGVKVRFHIENGIIKSAYPNFNK